MHTADNHIGIQFSGKSNEAGEALVTERTAALKRIVDKANQHNCDFLVVAGDLFDEVKFRLKDVRDVAKILNGFIGSVIIIPGNHDYYQSEPDKLWGKFSGEADEGKVFILHRYEVFRRTVGEQEVNFYPCSCRSKHSEVNMIGWVKNAEKNPGAINIGIAHGNVEGLGLDHNDRYFNMTVEELKSTGVDFWLLGHIHVPYPSYEKVEKNPDFFMPGTHTPDGWNRSHPGYAWMIEVDENKHVKAERIVTGKLRFYDWKEKLNTPEEINALAAKVNALDGATSFLRLNLDGRLSESEMNKMKELFREWESKFLEFDLKNNLKYKIDKEYINNTYPENTIAYKLLSALANEEGNDLALHLAHELIENNRK
ncbi:MAG: DNA repair exonuclease [Bacteroidia bacterium]